MNAGEQKLLMFLIADEDPEKNAAPVARHHTTTFCSAAETRSKLCVVEHS